MKVIKNAEKKGIELYFDNKPEQNIIDMLKANKFRWHNIKKCWYAKENQKALEAVENIKAGKIELEKNKLQENKLQELRLLNNEEKTDIARQFWKTKDMVDYIVKTYDFYITKDNYIIEIEKSSKVSVDKTLWYDDEQEAPKNNEGNFISYNMRLHNPMRSLENYLEERERLNKTGGASGKYDYNGIYISINRSESNFVSYEFFDEKDNRFIRYLTEKEEQDLINIMAENKEKYLDRLKKYYKRYGEKYVRAEGYWVNR